MSKESRFLLEGDDIELHQTCQHDPVQRHSPSLPWIISTCLSLALCAYLWLHGQQTGDVKAGAFLTDFEPLRSAVAYEERRFTGELTYDAKTRRVEPVRIENEVLYVGLPSPEIDANWDTLMKGQYAAMTPEEAAPYEPELVRLPDDDQFHFEPAVFHSLHCLNAIRKTLATLYPNPAYPSGGHHHSQNLSELLGQDDFDRIHMDHCIDQLRQTIQCHGDLSPAPMYYWKGSQIAIGRGSMRTCRKWEPIREWMNQRNAVMKPLPG